MPRDAAWLLLVVISAPIAVASFVAPRGGAVCGVGARRRRIGTSAAACTESSDDPGPQRTTFEVCVLDEDDEIESCEVVYRDELPSVLGIAQAAKVLNDPMASDVIFGRRVADEVAEAEGAPKVGEVFTVADYRLSVDADEIPKDVLLKGLGPDALRLLQDDEDTSSAAAALAGAESAAEAKMESRFHVHFGAGRLGMGLVVPAISASGVPFAVVQRPKPRWMELFRERGEKTGENELGVSVNSAVVVHNVEVIKSAEGTPSFMPPQSLIFGSTPDELQAVVDRATSFSCSLGSAMADVLLPLLETLPEVPRELQPNLFCCENDHDAVVRLKAALEGRVFVIDCMVDRVCTGRTITTEGVDVSAEPWRGSIVVLEPDLRGRLPFCSSVATAPRSAREAEYLSERKFTLVNGMHTVLAFMTLHAEFVWDDDGSGGPREYVLLKYTRAPRDAQRMCEAWRTARIAQLLEKFGVDDLMTWHGVSTHEEVWETLLTHADAVLEERFSRTDDVVSRVLGGGVANRWLTRIRPTDTWMAERAERSHDGLSDDGLSAFFAYALAHDRRRAIERGCHVDDDKWRGCEIEDACDVDAGCDAASVVEALVAALTRESQAFCTRDLQITHKQLVHEQRRAGGKAQAPRVSAAMAEQRGRGI